ncbi:MAG: hypothetical protein IKN70_06730 [Fibrobacter sp.]|nr:hypothetical protein [Fibrobacter sp.]
MKKKIILLSFLAVWAIALSACLFDSDEDGLSNWLSDHGLPDSYDVQTLSIEGLTPSKVEVLRDTIPSIAEKSIVFGNSSNMAHEMAVQFLYVSDTTYMNRFRDADTIGAYVSFSMLLPFYKDKDVPVKLLPIKENLKVEISWTLRKGKNKKFTDSLASLSDSVWLRSLENWEPDAVVDTTYDIKLTKSDTLVFFDLPGAFLDSIKTCRQACHLEMRFAAPETENLFRFYATEKKKTPVFRMRSVNEGDTLNYFKSYSPTRMASVTVNNDCSDCLVLHGGATDSLIVEFPSEPILNALADFYGDEFPYTVGDGYDVRQAVVLAQMTFARNDAEGENHLGLPLQVVSGAFIDSAGEECYKREAYKVNKKQVVKSGYSNMVFYDGDSLTLQITQAMRNFINRASAGKKLKIMMRLGAPQLQDKDSAYATHVVEHEVTKKKVVDGDTVETKVIQKDTSYVFLGYFDYARYDFSSMMDSPITLKLWLANKRSGRNDDE